MRENGGRAELSGDGFVERRAGCLRRRCRGKVCLLRSHSRLASGWRQVLLYSGRRESTGEPYIRRHGAPAVSD